MNKMIEILEKRLHEKEAELDELYSLVDRLNSYIANLIQDTESGIRAAASLQRKFSSKKLPKINDLTFASKYIISISELNSYYDFFKLQDDSGVGIVLCDSIGYGASATLMSIIMSLAETSAARSPKVFLETAFNDFKKCTKQEDVGAISIIYMVLERQTLKLKYSSLRMPSPMIIRGTERISLEISPDKQELFFKLMPGDRVIMPNNGILMTRDMNANEFGVDGLIRGMVNAEHLPISDIIGNISFELDSFIDGKRGSLYGDTIVLGMELERKMFYVV